MNTSIWTIIHSNLNDALIEMRQDRGMAADRIRFVQELINQFQHQRISVRISDDELNQIWESINE
jgi:hypothetical protein